MIEKRKKTPCGCKALSIIGSVVRESTKTVKYRVRMHIPSAISQHVSVA